MIRLDTIGTCKTDLKALEISFSPLTMDPKPKAAPAPARAPKLKAEEVDNKLPKKPKDAKPVATVSFSTGKPCTLLIRNTSSEEKTILARPYMKYFPANPPKDPVLVEPRPIVIQANATVALRSCDVPHEYRSGGVMVELYTDSPEGLEAVVVGHGS